MNSDFTSILLEIKKRYLVMSDAQLFQYFCDTTRNFIFYDDSVESCDVSEEFHVQRIKSLMQSVRRMAIRKSFQISGLECAGFERDDWIQQAMITMFECCRSYDGKRPFDNYVRFMVSKKMEDVRRTLLRKNPPVDSDRLRLYKKIKKVRGDKERMQKLVEESGYTEEELTEMVNHGAGMRIFTENKNEVEQEAGFQNISYSTPENSIEHNELGEILLHCINNLTELKQRVFRLHEMQQLSLRTIFDRIKYNRSFATFKRWYKSDVYESVKKCVISNA